MQVNIRIIIIYVAIVIGLTACIKKEVLSDENYPLVLSQALELLKVRDNVVEQPGCLKLIPEQNLAMVSTSEVDNFMLSNLDNWINVTTNLDSFITSHRNKALYNDSILVSSLAWISLSQADRKYCNSAIEICMLGQKLKYPVRLNETTVKKINEMKSVKFILRESNLEVNLYDFRSFFRRMVITEYLKMNDISGAEKVFNVFTKESSKQDDIEELSNFINLYKKIYNPKLQKKRK